MTEIAPGFTGSPLQRVDHLRDDPEAVAGMRADPAARLLALDGLDPVLGEDRGLSWAPLPEDAAPLVLLGLIDARRASRR